MAFSDDLTAEVVKILKEKWTERSGLKVPETEDLKLANDALLLKGTVLYADLADSTGMVLARTPEFAAEVYKCYLNCACRIIRDRGGEITAFDGDRVMAVFLGDGKDTRAMRAGLAINHAVVKILTPQIRDNYQNLPGDFAVGHAVGIDASPLFVARTGIRGSNDLVWVGRAANFAAKLCALREGDFALWVTGEVHDAADSSVRLNNDGKSMWQERTWKARNLRVLCSNYSWSL